MLKAIKKILSLLIAITACMWLVHTCAFSIIEVPTQGELPVFYAGDRITVNKWAYGLRATPMRWWGYQRWYSTSVNQGEWVVFNAPLSETDKPIDERSIFMAYCAAAPGDTLWIDCCGNFFAHRPVGAERCRTIIVPAADMYIDITPDNMPWYHHVITEHEGFEADIRNDSLFVSEHHVTNYRFKYDYYWMSAANSANYADSRTYGFVPHSHIIGRLDFVLFSCNPDAPWYMPFRVKRFGMKVNTNP